MDRTIMRGGIYSAERSITIDGEEIYLEPLIEYDSIELSRPAPEAVILARHERAQDLSDALWLREYGTIPGAPGRMPSEEAIKLSRIKPDQG